MILPKKFCFQNIEIKLNLRTCVTLKSSVVIFQALKLCSLIDLIGLCSFVGLTSLYSPISPKIFLVLMIGWSLAPKWSILSPFCGSSITQFFTDMYLIPFLLEAVEASWCYFLKNWLMKLKCPNLLKPLGTYSRKPLILLPHRFI